MSGGGLSVRLTGTGAFLGERRLGRPFWTMGELSPGFSVAAPATGPVALRARIRRCRLPTGSPARPADSEEERGESDRLWMCIATSARSRSSRRAGCARPGGSRPHREALELFAQSLDPRDHVALEVTGNAWAIARDPRAARGAGDRRLAERHRDPPGAREDRSPRRAGAGEAAVRPGQLDGVWTPDERIRAMRRRLARRAQLVRARSRAKNEIHAVLMRCLKGRPPASDLFGVKGRAWLAEQQLALDERETVDVGHAPGQLPRQRDRGGREADRRGGVVVAGGQAADDRPGGQRDRRGDVHGRGRRHPPLRRPAQADRLSRPGSARQAVRRRARPSRSHLKAGVKQRASRAGRGVLVDGAPARADRARFYQRVRARRGHSIAIVASARKLACLFWCLLTRGEDYAFAQPSLTKKKMRRLELHGRRSPLAGRPRRLVDQRCDAPRRTRARAPSRARLRTHREGPPTRRARVRHRGAHQTAPQRSKVARQTSSPNVCASTRRHSRPAELSHDRRWSINRT